MTAWFITLLAICSVSGAYYLKICVAKNTSNRPRYYFSFVLNLSFVFFYLDIINGKDPLLTFHPDLIADYPYIGWMAISCIFLHLMACPVRLTAKPMRFEDTLSTLTMYLCIIACAGFHTVWIAALIIGIFTLDVLAAQLLTGGCFVAIAGYCLKVMPKEFRKLEGK